MNEINVAYIGQRRSAVSGHYLLGNGYREFNPVLKQFASQDNLSPFGAGGVHGFAYCGGNPANWTDPSGHLLWELILISSRVVRVAADAEADAIVKETRQAFAASSEFDKEKRMAIGRPGRDDFINNVILNQNDPEGRTSSTIISEIRNNPQVNNIVTKRRPGEKPSNRNIARLQYRTTSHGNIYTRLCISGEFSSGRPRILSGNILVRPEELREKRFTGFVVKFSREYDTEALLLNDLDKYLIDNKLTTGDVYLHSEIAFCRSCQAVVQKFMNTYPNIHVFVNLW